MDKKTVVTVDDSVLLSRPFKLAGPSTRPAGAAASPTPPAVDAMTMGRLRHSPHPSAHSLSSNIKGSTAAAPPRKAPTRHHFPIYSHPMFRAALHNSASLRGALQQRLEEVDQNALDTALERMVDELMQQHNEQLQRGDSGQAGVSSAGPVVSEAALLALLASVSPTPTPSTAVAAQQISPFAASPALGATDSGMRNRAPLHSSHPPLYPTLASTRHAAGTYNSNAAAAAAGDVETGTLPSDDVHVVSVHALQREAALAQSASLGGSAPVYDTTVASPYASTIPHTPPRPTTLGVPAGAPAQTSEGDTHHYRSARAHEVTATAATATASPFAFPHGATSTVSGRVIGLSSVIDRAKAPSSSVKLYSLLPLSGAAVAGSAGGDGGGGVPFAEIDRRPGVTSGPVAQQSVDQHQLHHVSYAVFAAMDLLMDGNSCCVRRRQRPPASSSSRNTKGSAALTSGHSTFTGYSSLYVGGGRGGGYASGATTRQPHAGGLAPPAASRTPAEAKARRILEAQRRRTYQQRQQQQQAHIVAESGLYTAGGTARPITPLAAHSPATIHGVVGQGSSAITHDGSPSTHGSASTRMTGPPVGALPPLKTTRDLAGRSAFERAFSAALRSHSANL